jgi:hypothetical protein
VLYKYAEDTNYLFSEKHMNRITSMGMSTLVETFSMLRSNLPKGWVWDPILVKSSGLKPDSSEDFNITFYKRMDHGMVVFCSGYKDRRQHIKVLIAYHGEKKMDAISVAKKMHPEWDMTREGEIRYGVKALVGVTNIPLPAPKGKHEKQSHAHGAMMLKHHGETPKQKDKQPVWTKSWKTGQSSVVAQAKVWMGKAVADAPVAEILHEDPPVKKAAALPTFNTDKTADLRKRLALTKR